MLHLFSGAAAAVTLAPNTEFTIFPSSPSLGGSWFTTFQFTVEANTTAELTVVDMCHGGDQYEIFNFGSSLGFTTPIGSFTSNCLLSPTQAETIALPDPRWGEAIFNLGPGTYDISGVTTVDGGPGANRAAIRLDVEELPTVIPEPSTLLGLGLALGLGALSLNRKQKK